MSAQNDFIDLEICALEDRHEPTATRFRVRIDDERYNIEDPKPTGRQLLALADKRPADEHLIFLILRGGGFEEIQVDETIDLTRRGTERFLTFESSASYRLEIDGQRIEWGTKLITGLKLKELAGVHPATYALWQEVRGGEDLPVNNDQIIDLSADGLERFFTVIEQTTAGEALAGGVLPRRDKSYLTSSLASFAEMNDRGQTGVILKNYPLPAGKFDTDSVDILILMPGGYPDTAPDMFYCSPWLRLKATGAFPKCADVPHVFGGANWQRWSRHNSQWRAGKDGIWTMIKRVERAIAEAA